jgi:hypothetical protein
MSYVLPGAAYGGPRCHDGGRAPPPPAARRTGVAVKRDHRIVPVITTAEVSPAEQLHSRQVRYLVLNGLRVVCLVAATISYPHWFLWVFLAGFGLSWPAVLIANDRPPLRPGVFHRFLHPGKELPAAAPDRIGDEDGENREGSPRVIDG